MSGERTASSITAAYIGIDIGTSGCRAVAIDTEGRELATGATTMEKPHRAPTGQSCQDPAVWWRALREALSRLLAELTDHTPAGVAIDGTSGTLLLADSAGQPLGPALMYDDASSRAEAAKIALTAPPESPVHGPSSSLAKALALQGRLGTGRARTLAHQADWLNGCLTGRFGLSDPNNCLKLGYDSQEGRWPDWLVSLPLPSLPNVKTRGSLLGGVTRAAAEETGLPAGTPVFTGTTDSTAACLAAGLEQPGQALTVLGSTLVLKVLSARPLNAPGYGVYSHPFGRAWLVGGASNSGGNVLEKFFSREEMAELTGGVDPEHLVRLGYYPLVNPGERFPVNDPQWMPRLAPRPGDPAKFFQALLEGIAEIERRGYRLLDSLGAPAPVEVITIGGGARNPAWQAIRERLLGLPVRCALHEEPAYGSALLAREGALARQR